MSSVESRTTKQQPTSQWAGKEAEAGTWWPEILESHKIVDIFEYQDPEHPQDIVFFNDTENVKNILEQLRFNKILSAPVYNEEQNRFIGFLDLLDITTFVASKLDTSYLKSAHHEELIGKELLDQQADVLMNISETNPWITVEEDAPVIDVMSLFTATNIHRVPVISKDRHKIKAIATQLIIVRWLNANVVPLLPRQTLPNVWDVATKDVIMMEETKRAFEAFHVLHDEKISAIPIVNAQGVLSGTISVSDIKGIIGVLDPEKELIKILRMPIKDYIVLAKSVYPDIKNRALNQNWSCHPEDTLPSALQKLATSGVHRLWVVDQESKPIGVLSLADVLSAFALL